MSYIRWMKSSSVAKVPILEKWIPFSSTSSNHLLLFALYISHLGGAVVVGVTVFLATLSSAESRLEPSIVILLYGTSLSILLFFGHFGHGFVDELGGQGETGGHEGHVGAIVGILVVH